MGNVTIKTQNKGTTVNFCNVTVLQESQEMPELQAGIMVIGLVLQLVLCF